MPDGVQGYWDIMSSRVSAINLYLKYAVFKFGGVPRMELHGESVMHLNNPEVGILCGPRTGASQITSDSCSYGHSKGTLKILNHDFIFSNENLVNRKYA